MTPVISRRCDLDVVREVIVVSVIFFHTARIFDDLGFYVKNEPLIPALTFVVSMAALWGMPLMFMISGYAIRHSLQKRTVSAFVRERLQRLLVPFVISLVVIVPPQIYFELLSDPAYQQSYLQFYPRFFDITFDIDFPWFVTATPESGYFHPAHLWFIYNLLIYTLLMLPLFLYLRQERGQQIVERVVCYCATHKWAVFLFALPLAVIESSLGVDLSGGWNQFAYLFILCYGYIVASDERFGQLFNQYRRAALVIALVASVLCFVGLDNLVNSSNINPFESNDAVSITLRFIKGLAGWFWIVAIIGYLESARYKRQHFATQQPAHSKSSVFRLERYANDAILPIYLLHQTLVVIIGFYVVQWESGALLKFLAISLSTLVITLLLYEFVIKRMRVTRFLFGMRPYPIHQ